MRMVNHDSCCKSIGIIANAIAGVDAPVLTYTTPNILRSRLYACKLDPLDFSTMVWDVKPGENFGDRLSNYPVVQFSTTTTADAPMLKLVYGEETTT
jgi:hypothetical protein